MASIRAAALRSRSGGQTTRLTSRPTAIPMPVSASRSSRVAASSLAPVVSTTSAVAAAVVLSARRPLIEPAASATRMVSPSDSALSPSRLPRPKATRTPSTVAPTCWAPRRNVR